jgi:glutamate dehydrogenase/leucine dehydrogenase
MDENWRFADELGPETVAYLHEPGVGLRAILVVDNTACGPSIGGARMAPDVTVEECFRLARAMTMKNAAAGLPHGGGKSVIIANPRMPERDKERLMRAFARAIEGFSGYIVGPDMGTDERCMAWARDEIGRAVGLPPEIGGIPLDVIGATGYGLAAAAEVAQEFADLRLDGARAVIQGFGSVGRHAARFLAARGVRVVAVADSRGARASDDGLDVEALVAHKLAGGAVADFGGGVPTERDTVVEAECDLLVPAARPDIINEGNVERVRARLVVPGANIPATPGAERRLHQRGVLLVPDFIANAGGVICAAVEYRGGTQSEAFAAIAAKVRANTTAVLSRARDTGLMPREAAVALARERVDAAMTLRRFHA